MNFAVVGLAFTHPYSYTYESQLRDNAPVRFPLSQRDSGLYRLRAAGQL